MGGVDSISFLADACCIQNVFYSAYQGHLFISSHTNLMNDILGLEWDNYISKLVRYRFFNLLGNYLPGNLTQYKEVRRLVPNHVLTYNGNYFEAHRFYTPKKINLPFEQIRDSVSVMLHNNLQLITKKWDQPAISLTGGCDSRTTLSCANGLYDKFKYFSYISDEAESVDADAAHKICEKLGLEHTIYHIPDNDNDVGDVQETAKLLRWNTGDIRNSNPNDVRKRSVLLHKINFDVEVKSWCSEIARAYYSKRFAGKTNFGKKPNSRVATTLYKFFLTERGLVRNTDKVFEQYFKDWFKQDDTSPIEWQEQFFWEFRVAAWNGLVITGEHQYTNEITIPYNNRRCLELMLSVPIDQRLSDDLYKAIRDKMNADIDTIVPTVVNLRHTALRAKLEWLYYQYNLIIP